MSIQEATDLIETDEVPVHVVIEALPREVTVSATPLYPEPKPSHPAVDQRM